MMKAKKEQKAKKQLKNGKKIVAATSSAARTGQPNAGAKRTIKQVVIETIAANSAATNDEMIAAVKAEFPTSAFNDKHAAWYRSQARLGKLTGSKIGIPPMSRKTTAA